MHVFLSYASSQSESAAHIASYFERNGVKAWYAHRDIPAGAVWNRAISQAIWQAGAFLVLFCEEADRSVQVNREVVLADERKLPIFWLRLQDIKPDQLSYFLSSSQWFDWMDQRDATLESLVKTFHAILGRSSGIAESAVEDEHCVAIPRENHQIESNQDWPLGIAVFDDEPKAAEGAAHLVLQACKGRYDGSLVLPTGSTATKLFKGMLRVVEEYGPAPFGGAHIVNDTETFGVSISHETSRSRHVMDTLIRPLWRRGYEIPEENIHLISGLILDVDPIEQTRRVLRAEPPFMHAVAVSPSGEMLAYEVGVTRDADSIISDQCKILEVNEQGRRYIDPNQPSRSIISVGLGTCMASETVVLLAFDESKARILNQMVSFQESPGVPATLLRRHPGVLVVTTSRVIRQTNIMNYTILREPIDVLRWKAEIYG